MTNVDNVDNVFTFLQSHTQDLLWLKYYHCKSQSYYLSELQKNYQNNCPLTETVEFLFLFNSWLVSAQLPQGVNQWSLSRSFVQLLAAKKLLEDSQESAGLYWQNQREKPTLTWTTMEAFYYGLVLCSAVAMVCLSSSGSNPIPITMPVFTAVLSIVTPCWLLPCTFLLFVNRKKA